MSAGKFARLDAVARRAAGEGSVDTDPFILAVEEAGRFRAEQRALAEAQAEALAVQQPPEAAPADSPPPAPVKKRPPPERPRPDQHTEVTWEEAMRVPWVEPDFTARTGAIFVERPAENAPRPDGWVDPWPNGGFIFPSYARTPEKEEE